jgi:protoporphyrinogen oxidase
MTERVAIIIGAGPAGLTAAFELAGKSDVKPLVFEAADDVGGIARTFRYKGNHIDLGGHRFFSKSDRVMDWWRAVLPLQRHVDSAESRIEISYQNKTRWIDLPEDGPNPDETDDVMLVRERVSRILFGGRFFDYPLSLSFRTLANLGLPATMRIGFSYMRSHLFPVRPENTLEDFFINRFGRELYSTFFRDYTEKVWGVPCREISAEWGAQRIKGLSIVSVLVHAFKKLLPKKNTIAQKEVETSLIEQFLYPKFGPGHMWERVRRLVEERGGEVRFERRVVGLKHDGERVIAALVEDEHGAIEEVAGDYFFSTMPVRELIAGLDPAAPEEVREVSEGLVYRDFMTVGLLLDSIKLGGGGGGRGLHERVPDNWIYIQEQAVRVGRLQIFNNWSPYMVADPDKVWIGLEYFVDEGDDLWSMDDEAMVAFAAEELELINVIDRAAVLDAVVIRQPKAYPAYFGTYDRFDTVREFTDGFANLFLVGRNGMHRYNNQDHSMLAAMVAVENILDGVDDKKNIWEVNTETEYHEEK